MLTASTLLPVKALLSTGMNMSTAAAITAAAMPTVAGRCASVQPSTRWWSPASRTSSFEGAPTSALSTRPIASGITVSDRNSEQASVKMMVLPTSPTQIVTCVRPPSTSGRNTMIEVAVDETTAGSTSRLPRSAARRRGAPRSRCRWMLSRITTALSTSMPTASISPIMERMLSERPPK